MLVKTAAIVVKKIPYTDHASVVTLLTQEHGLLRFLVQGLHGKQAKNAYYQLGNLIEVVYNHKQSGGLFRVKETSLLHQGTGIESFAQQQLKWFYLEIVSYCVHEEQIEQGLFEFISMHFQLIHRNQIPMMHLPILFLLGLGEITGFEVNWTLGKDGSLDLITGQIANSFTPVQFKSHPWCNQAIIQYQQQQFPNLSKHERREIIDKLILHLQYHLFPNKSVKSLEIFDMLND